MEEGFILRRRRGMRSVRLRVDQDGRVLVSAPRSVPDFFIRRFVDQKRAWIEDAKQKMATLPKKAKASERRASYKKHKEQARSIIEALVRACAAHYGFSYHRISIKNQTSCWGSCSKRGNLNFNYRVAFLAPELAQYVVVHEVCHLKEHNHSTRFWDLVARTISDHKERRRTLRKHSLLTIM